MNEDKIYLYSTPSRGTIFPSKLRPDLMLLDDLEKPMPKYMGPDETTDFLNYGWPKKVIAEHRGLGKSSFNANMEAELSCPRPTFDDEIMSDTFTDSLAALKYNLEARSAMFSNEAIAPSSASFNPGRISRSGYVDLTESVKSHAHIEHMIFMARMEQESFAPYPVGSKENPLLIHHSLVCYAKQKLKLHVITISPDRLGDNLEW